LYTYYYLDHIPDEVASPLLSSLLGPGVLEVQFVYIAAPSQIVMMALVTKHETLETVSRSAFADAVKLAKEGGAKQDL
jgi:hypothetical protein